MVTVKGIYLNLPESIYFYKIGGLKFFFSSQMYLEKFKNEVVHYCNEETIKINNKYKINIALDSYLMISLYNKIEKRGFYIIDELNSKEITRNILFTNTIISY